ncbi:hypothetical protein FQN54_001878 [Arachnomyces sp. PD_36]|nr:hypothetical protein FQN54_001878 [Arachnomyces sp. PD_36]
MPFHGHRRSSSPGNHQEGPSNSHGAVGGMFQATQTLGSIGAPGVLTSAGTDGLFFSDSSTRLNGDGNPSSSRRNSELPNPGAQQNTAPAGMTSTSQSFNASQRGPAFGRQPEELHIPTAHHSLGSNDRRQQGQSQIPSQADYGQLPPAINVQQSSSNHPQYPAGNSTLPGALQSGHMSRPGPSSTNTAPSSLATLSQLSTQPPTTSAPSRSSTINNNHGYSRSSPAGFDHQKYKQVGSTPDSGKYMSPNSAGYQSQTPQASPYSPLGLADIRPHTESGLPEDITSPNVHANEYSQVPTNSNYLAPWAAYALDWCKWPSPPNSSSAGKIALGSYLEDSHNFIQILSAQRTPPSHLESDHGNGEPGLEFVKTAEATHSYPVTRILWEPPSSQKPSTDLLATSGDHLRLWSLPIDPHTPSYPGNNSINRSGNLKNPPVQKLSPLALLSNSKSPEHTAPITSLDWNVVSPSLIITSSIDTTCTIWDIPTLTAKTQLIAHDKEVFDVRFCANSVDVFVSCGADGSVRMFDLRSLEHSTIIYEPSEKSDRLTSPGNMTPPSSQTNPWPPPLLRIAASPHDAHLLGTFSQDSNLIRILDVRQPGQALLELKGHSSSINCIEWSPTRRGTLASGADDSLVLVWDLINQSNAAALPPNSQSPHVPTGTSGANPSGSPTTTLERGPAAAWQCDYEVSNISWAPNISGAGGHGRDWLGVCGGRGLWGVSL